MNEDVGKLKEIKNMHDSLGSSGFQTSTGRGRPEVVLQFLDFS
jgi:hypothetical protein